jgi:hypothetical protein
MYTFNTVVIVSIADFFTIKLNYNHPINTENFWKDKKHIQNQCATLTTEKVTDF